MRETAVVGIVAEYNPFHNGHAYHIRRAREISGADSVVVVLSSNFVQRGEPALLDKWSRTESAIAGGADLVLELPVPFSSHNAGVFAKGALDILSGTGVVTHLSFGMEVEIPRLETILDILLHEPPPFKEKLKASLEKGASFVEARSLAIETMVPGAKPFLSTPNNNLALAYLLELSRAHRKMRPAPVRRIGSGFHSPETGELASASAIREQLRKGQIETVREALPEKTFKIILRDMSSGRCFLDEDRLMAAYRILLSRASAEDLRGMAEMGEGIEGRFKAAVRVSKNLEDFISRCVTKRYPRGRVCRHLVHALIGLDHWTNRAYQRLGPPCIRILGANRRGRQLLGEMRSRSTLPLLSRCDESGSFAVCSLMRLERTATDIWETLVPGGRPDAEKKALPILVP